MKIATNMNLDSLIERMGDATETEAIAMREMLVDKYDGMDTNDIAENDWLDMLEKASSV